MPEDGNERYDKVSRIINYELNEINKEIRKAPRGGGRGYYCSSLINKIH